MSAEGAGTSYRAVLSSPHALRLFLPATAGRLAYGVLPLALFFTVAGASGSLSAAGLSAAALNLTVVVAGPLRARLVDRCGRRVLPLLALLYAASTALLVTAAYADAPLPVLLALAALAGACPPPLGPAMRVAWAQLTPEGPLRLRAYSLDAVVEEILFTAGPLLTGVAIAAAAPQAALVAAFGLLITGAALFGFAPGPPAAASAPASSAAPGRARLLRSPRFVAMLLIVAGFFGGLGLVDVAVPVAAVAAGSPAAAGYLLAALSAGSVVGGLLFGRRTWRTPFAALLPRAAGLLGVLVVVLALLPSLWLLGVGLLLAGLVLSPGLIMAYALAEQLSPESARTEASVWVNTACNAGITAGTALAGLLADAAPRWLLFALGGALVLAAAAIPGRLLSRPATSAPPVPLPQRA